MEMMNIGQAAKASGVSAKMIRHYEEVGLVPAAVRSESGYRLYRAADIHTLGFIRHARDLGFSIAVIGKLLGLWQNRRRSSRTVKAVAQAHIEELEQKAKNILAMKATLEHLVQCCNGDDRPDCPIIENLAGPLGVESAALEGPPAAVKRSRHRGLTARHQNVPD